MFKKLMKSALALLMMVSFIQPLTVHAVSVVINVDKENVETDEVVTFTITADGTGYLYIDGQKEWFEAGSQTTKTITRSYPVAGSYSFSVTGTLADPVSAEESDVSDSVVITVIEPVVDDPVIPTPPPTTDDPEVDDPVVDEKSDDARLYSLSVDKGTLSPSFVSSTYDYSVELTSEETEITIKAEAWDDHATVEGAGLKPIKLGTNSFTVDVTAEDGKTKKEYTINVIVKEIPMVYLSYNDQEYGIMREYENADVPKGFSVTEGEIDGQKVPFFENEMGTIQLVYATDPEGRNGFYLYTKEDGILALYRPLIVNGKEVFIIDIPESLKTREAMSYTTLTIQEETMDAWIFDDDRLVDYSLIYVMNDEGDKAYYVYDAKNRELIDYPESAPTTYEEFDEWLDLANAKKGDNNLVLYASMGVAALVVVGIVVWLMKKNKKVVEEDDDEDIEEQHEVTKEFKREVIEEEVVDEDDDEEEEEEIVSTYIQTDLEKMKNANHEEMTIPEESIDEEENEWLTNDFLSAFYDDEE